jgi:hypothetical protein
VEVLAKEAQTALSVVWTVIGFGVLGVGLLLRRSMLRLAGLAVLALATMKVFVVDLSSLDVAYRVIVLIVLGLLLVISAYAWSRRVKPTDDGAAPDAPDRSADGTPSTSPAGPPDTGVHESLPSLRRVAHHHHAAGHRPRGA